MNQIKRSWRWWSTTWRVGLRGIPKQENRGNGVCELDNYGRQILVYHVYQASFIGTYEKKSSTKEIDKSENDNSNHSPFWVTILVLESGRYCHFDPWK